MCFRVSFFVFDAEMTYFLGGSPGESPSGRRNHWLGSLPFVGRARLNTACATVEDATPIAEESSERQNVRPARVSPPSHSAPSTMVTSRGY